MNLLSAQAKALVVSVDYRLAPEHPLPAAYEDSWNSLKWVWFHVAENISFEKEEWLVNHGDFSKIFIGGDSAGGNLAHYATVRAGSEPLPGNSKISGAILSHPFFWGSIRIGSEPKEDIEQSLSSRIWFLAYPSVDHGIDSPLINPIADGAPSLSLLGCSKLLVCLAEKDVLTGRGFVYVEKLKQSGWKGEVEVVEVEGEDHCFHVFYPENDKAKD